MLKETTRLYLLEVARRHRDELANQHREARGILGSQHPRTGELETELAHAGAAVRALESPERVAA